MTGHRMQHRRPVEKAPTPEPTTILMIQRCGAHLKANILFDRNGKYTCYMCGRELRSEMVEPPQR
jgi:hypothetical protein